MMPNIRDIEYFEVCLGRAKTAYADLDYPTARLLMESAAYALEVIQRSQPRIAHILRKRYIKVSLMESELQNV